MTSTQDHPSPDEWPDVATAEWWEERYSSSERIWSRRANRALVDIASTLEAGRALDVGSGEGADVVWLAKAGWEAVGVDVSATATARATHAAHDAGIDGARFVTGGIDDAPGGDVDLVTSSFLHSPAERPREEILRRAAERVATGGHLLITSHASPPPWVPAEHAAHHRFDSPLELRDRLELDPDDWETVLAEIRPRETVDPSGNPATIDDGVLLLRRR